MGTACPVGTTLAQPGQQAQPLGEMDQLWMDTWREVFYEHTDKVKPEDEWDLQMDQGLTPKALPWGWTQVVEKHGLARGGQRRWGQPALASSKGWVQRAG